MAWRSCFHWLDGFWVYEAGSWAPGGDLEPGATLSVGHRFRQRAAMGHAWCRARGAGILLQWGLLTRHKSEMCFHPVLPPDEAGLQDFVDWCFLKLKVSTTPLEITGGFQESSILIHPGFPAPQTPLTLYHPWTLQVHNPSFRSLGWEDKTKPKKKWFVYYSSQLTADINRWEAMQNTNVLVR